MIKIAVHKHDPSKEINSQLQDNFFKDDSFFVELCWNRIINQRTHSYIKELNEDHLSFKDEIEANHRKFEKLIDEAADEISNFVDKAKLENISQ